MYLFPLLEAGLIKPIKSIPILYHGAFTGTGFNSDFDVIIYLAVDLLAHMSESMKII